MIIYNYVKKDDKVEFKTLIDVTDLDTDGEITERDVKAMELALITTMKPKYNYAGVKGPYRW